MAMIASALFIDGRLDRRLANHWTKQPCFQLLRRQDGEAGASRKGSISGQYGLEKAFLEPRYHPELLRNSSSLIRPTNSLITCFNSLQSSKDFPVRVRRELAGKALI